MEVQEMKKVAKKWSKKKIKKIMWAQLQLRADFKKATISNKMLCQ